jgi:hypothetical protein
LDYAWATATIIMIGVLVEILEGVTLTGNCRMRDLIPDAVGALVWSIDRARALQDRMETETELVCAVASTSMN